MKVCRAVECSLTGLVDGLSHFNDLLNIERVPLRKVEFWVLATIMLEQIVGDVKIYFTDLILRSARYAEVYIK